MDALKTWLPLIAVAGYFLFLVALWLRHMQFEKNLQMQVGAYLSSKENAKPNESNND
jgi:hypothetical protein